MNKKPFKTLNDSGFIYILAISIIMIMMVSCDGDDDADILQTQDVTLSELNKDIIQVNVTNTATGLRNVFNTMVTDSTSRAHLSQAFVNEARFFSDNSGYFFIETLNEAWVVAHINPDFIGTSRINATDANGKYHVQEIVNTVNNIGYGFVEYVFPNPANGQEEDKLSFVTDTSPADWFIGAGVYDNNHNLYYETFEANKLLVKEITQTMAKGISGVLEDIYSEETDDVNFCRNFLSNIRFFDDQSGYFFILNFDGLSIVNAAQPEIQGQNLWDVQDSQGTYVVREASEIVQSNPDGGFYDYYWPNPATGQDEHKTSYVVQIPGTNYFIGAGVYQE